MSGDEENKKIAMWSGPRNLSTAMMYCFAQRSDTTVIDEPFYAAYLAATGFEHAMYHEVIEDGEIDFNKVIDKCIGDNPEQKPIFYQKQMTKHMLPHFDRGWMKNVQNVFLIREPAFVISSYHEKQENPELSDIGIKEQLEIFEMVSDKIGKRPIVINSDDILASPEKMLRRLCKSIGIYFQLNMLTWKKGPKIYDGIWAPHWYESVWKSSCFENNKGKKIDIPDHLLELLETSNYFYEKIKKYSL